jgi:predicted Zn-dependent protease with MMP-like domain
VINVSDDEFNLMIARAMQELPREHTSRVKNVAILWADEPDNNQLASADVHPGFTLFGLYQGVPLTKRQGRTNFPPDIITLFRGPLSRSVNTSPDLQESVKHTLWHEIAHYFGLGHDRIHELER